MGEKIASENGRIYDFRGLVTLTLTLDRVILHTSCIIRRPLPTYQILLISKKRFVDGRRTPTYCQIRSHVTKKLGKYQKSGPNKLYVLCHNLRIRGHLPARIVNGGGDSL